MKLTLVLVLFVAAVTASPNTSLPALFEAGRVVGGENAKPHSHPYIVSLQSGSHFCGGSIVTKDWVVTAAHCLVYPRFTVVAGAHNLRDGETGTRQTRQTEFMKSHEKYGGNVGPYDIGVIRVDRPFEFNEFVQPIKLPRPDYIHTAPCELAGWGSTSTSIAPSMPNILQRVDLPIIPMDECMKVIAGSPVHETNVCTGPLTGGLSACSGDSGGPLVQEMGQKRIKELVGVVSWGYIPCGQRGRPAVFTRTSAHIDWINQWIQY